MVKSLKNVYRMLTVLPDFICFADYAAAVFPVGFARQSICYATGLPRRNLGEAEMKTGGEEGIRTLDPRVANAMLYQLSYFP